MNIIERFDVTQKWHEEFDRKVSDINEIVIHGTGGGKSANDLIDWIEGGERQKSYIKGIGLFHFIIDYNGDIYQIAPILKWFFHSTCGQHDRKTIGIEFMNESATNKNEYTLCQYESLIDVIKYILKISDNKEFKIVGHDYNGLYYSSLVKGCPGNFDWNKLYDDLFLDGVTVHKINYKNQQGLKITR